jgi:hypothetical protein
VEVSVGLRLIWLVAILLIASCNPLADYALVGSAYVPAAHGEIEIEKIDKKQILVTVLLDHLDPPEKVELGLTHYVIWFSAPGGLPVRQRALEYDAKSQTGRASIPTSLREFELQITAENGDSPSQPSDLVVASQQIREN